jgi:hypothetical protein
MPEKKHPQVHAVLHRSTTEIFAAFEQGLCSTGFSLWGFEVHIWSEKTSGGRPSVKTAQSEPQRLKPH